MFTILWNSMQDSIIWLDYQSHGVVGEFTWRVLFVQMLKLKKIILLSKFLIWEIDFFQNTLPNQEILSVEKAFITGYFIQAFVIYQENKKEMEKLFFCLSFLLLTLGTSFFR